MLSFWYLKWPSMINGVSQARCAYIPSTDSVLPERRRSLKRAVEPLRPRANNDGTYYPETNYCGDVPTTYFNATLVGGKTYRLRLINSGRSGSNLWLMC